MTEFKIHVERIVRPILATESRKNKMREELMHHLISAHDDAITDGETDPIACALQGLGDPNALREELQDSVPWAERIGHLRSRIPGIDDMDALRQPSSTPAWKLALRASGNLSLLLFGLLALLTLPGAGYLQWTKAGAVDWPNLLEQSICIIQLMFYMGLALFVSTYFFRKTGLYKLVHCSSNTPVLLKGSIETLHRLFSVSLFFVLATIQMHQTETDTFNDITTYFFRMVAATTPLFLPLISLLALTFSVLIIAYGTHRERQHYLEWGHLEIDE